MIHSTIGLFHTAMAFLAMATGATVIFMRKGTKRHKQWGYIYVTSMLLLNGSAFFIYNFGNRPSLFHLFALISLATLVAGIVPAITKKHKNWYPRHFYFMSWSVVGLYCAFWAETGTRLLNGQHFWWAVAIASTSTALVGKVFIDREAKKLFGKA
ncbi:DUF2306 domain-containing protein [Roseivirga thermotolerans]|uniref:DUF2306 domain-containing protein n=1 Tax=Roseivirga thermotolerans TaxID=1758176 RepID=A0ABQ3I804_9BACT|nr:DUF2306 domain-containing protein [Roseivirga thermotolerans]GHE58082.1 hypothetical protein GCM10011340_11600 [Roseivirga thermotolerans]